MYYGIVQIIMFLSYVCAHLTYLITGLLWERHEGHDSVSENMYTDDTYKILHIISESL